MDIRHFLPLFLLLGAASPVRGQGDLALLEERAMKAAVAHVAPSVVRIDTVGGLERVGQVLFGSGPTTGLIVSDDGYIVSSAFNFAQKPSTILVTLPDGQRQPARLVATDHNRMLVLLKVESAAPLPLPEAAPESQLRVGQWSIAVGRTFESDQPNVSVGIISALKRIWGKSIQTDAKISPSNYGGPLVDIQGRVLGVLVPLSPQETGNVAGADWYDSGIGFAVPLEQIQSMLPRLKAGEDLHPGILGVNLRSGDQFADEAVIAACRANSPAYTAGFKPEDKIIEIDGQAVTRQVHVKQRIGPHYAGDKIQVVVLRGEERIEREVELIAKLEPYEHPFLGILPLRVADAPGVPVRYVYPDSPAAQAGIAVGDVLTGVDGAPVENRERLLEKIAALTTTKAARIGVRRGDNAIELEVQLTTLPEAIPDELPPARAERQPVEGQRPQVGRFDLKLPEFPNNCLALVPESYDPAVPHGIVVWLNSGGSYTDEELEALAAAWKPRCQQYDLIFLAPRSAAGSAWDPSQDLPFLRKVLDQLRAAYTIDPTRIVACGQQGGGSLAYLLAFAHRDLVRAVVAVDAPPAGTLAENEPIYRLAFYMTKAKSAASAAQVEAAVQKLREMKYPVTVQDLGDETRPLSDEELAALLRWIDALDRI